MGIPSFFAYIAKRYDKNNLLIKSPHKRINRLFLDLNGIIHPCSHKVISELVEESNINAPLSVIENRIIQKTITYISEITKEINPSSLLYIAIDGVAPRAKMFQQRKRRFKSVQDRALDPTKPVRTKWDSNAITPGTLFMSKLSNSIKNSPVLKNLEVKNIILSDASVPKEGEHKLVEYIRNNVQEDGTADVIHGLDADLIMLSSLLYPQNIYLFRDDAQRKEKYYMDISYFLDCVKHNFDGLLHDDIPLLDIIREYVFLCFFMGNDFLPHHYSLEIRDEAIDLIIELYCNIKNNTKAFLTDKEGNINNDFLKSLVSKLMELEDTLVVAHAARIVYKQAKRHGHTDEDKFNYFPDYHRNIEKRIGFGGEKWRDRYYEHVATTVSKGSTDTPELRKQMCNFYIQGLVWNMRYYLGKEISNTWYYPYHHAPTFIELHARLSDLTNDKLKNCVKPTTKQFTPFEQLLLVLPPQSSQLLPKSWSFVMRNAELFPKRIRLNPVGSIFRWQCPPILYYYPDNIYLNEVKNLPLSYSEKKRSKIHKSPLIIKKGI